MSDIIEAELLSSLPLHTEELSPPYNPTEEMSTLPNSNFNGPTANAAPVQHVLAGLTSMQTAMIIAGSMTCIAFLEPKIAIAYFIRLSRKITGRWNCSNWGMEGTNRPIGQQLYFRAGGLQKTASRKKRGSPRAMRRDLRCCRPYLWSNVWVDF